MNENQRREASKSAGYRESHSDSELKYLLSPAATAVDPSVVCFQCYPQPTLHLASPRLTAGELHRISQRIRVAQLGQRAWIAFDGLGDSLIMIVVRLILLWTLALPLLLLRAALAVIIVWATMGFFQLATSTATIGGGVVFQTYYREVVEFAAMDPIFQQGWDYLASLLTLTLSIFV
jgi:hypothetical protein